MYDEFETGMSAGDHVMVEAFRENGDKISLTVNPVGQFNPGGCIAFVSAKKDKILPLQTTEELFHFLLDRIWFENYESAFDTEDCTLRNMMVTATQTEVSEDNEQWLPYFKRLETKVAQFYNDLLSVKDLKDLQKVVIHQLHEASGELCDFVDYTCCPEGDENDEIRDYLEGTLSNDSEIDAIMDLFEDGYCQISSFCGDEAITVDFGNGTYEKKMTVTDVR